MEEMEQELQLRVQQPKGGQVDIKAARALKDELWELTQDVHTLYERRGDLWAHLPNLLAEDTTPGDDEGNEELS